MKSKLLRGIVKDLMKFPIGEKKMPGAPGASLPHGKGEVQITIHAGKGPMEDSEPEMEDAMEGEGGEMEDPTEDSKHLAMNKALHAKMKGKI